MIWVAIMFFGLWAIHVMLAAFVSAHERDVVRRSWEKAGRPKGR